MKTQNILLPLAAFAAGVFFAKRNEGAAVGKQNATLQESLLKELHKLQRYLNSNRLRTYNEGDESAEEFARQRERAAKLKRFDAVRELLNQL
jgi:hypothetical protein